jgi:adenylate kinase
MFNFNIIFIAGVHGVGKSHFCTQLKNTFKAPIFSASQLIKEVKMAEIDINKKVIDAEKNQEHLIIALKGIKTTSKIILLDGHFCLLNDNGIINVPEEIFHKMPLKAIFVLYDYPEKIYQRMKNRDNTTLSVDIISELQYKEIERAEFIANLINIPFNKIHFCDTDNYCINKIKYFINNCV